MIFTDKIIYIHMQKTGGTHIASLLSKYFKGHDSGRKHDWLHARDYDTEKYILGSIRSPWDWYVSLWAYGIQNRDGVYSRLTSNKKRKQIWLSTYQDFKNHNSFRKWLKLMFSPDRKQELGEGYHEGTISTFIGFMTYRYCLKYLKHWGRNKKKIKDFHTLVQYDKHNNLLNFTIKTESLESDLINALKLAGYQVNMNIEKKIYASSKNKVNVSKHEKASYYYDDETIKLVEEKERFIIEKYGYAPPF